MTMGEFHSGAGAGHSAMLFVKVGKRMGAGLITDGALPVANAHARVSAAGIKLILVDNGPRDQLPGPDYVSLISADNFGLGKMAAEGLAAHLEEQADVGVLGYDSDFFATNEREIAFVKWMRINRPRHRLHVARFPSLSKAADTALDLVNKSPGMEGLFVV